MHRLKHTHVLLYTPSTFRTACAFLAAAEPALELNLRGVAAPLAVPPVKDPERRGVLAPDSVPPE